MEELIKIYYQKDTGYLCLRYPYDIPVDDNCTFIEVDEQTYNNTLACEVGNTWAVVNGELKEVPMPSVQTDPSFIEKKKEWHITDLQQFLDDTDYIITKLSELKLEDEEEYEQERAKYAEILEQRKAARQELRELKSK